MSKISESSVTDLRSGLQVAVSGSGGLIGSALCRQLSQAGYRVRPIVRHSTTSNSEVSTTQAPGDSAVGSSRLTTALDSTKLNQAIPWDPERGLLDPSQLNSIHCVVHLAGHSIASHRWTSSEKQLIRDSRVAATRRIVDQVLQLDTPPSVFVSASAVGIYGDQGTRIVDEQTLPANEFLADVARDWEDVCQPLAEKGIRVVHPRFGLVLAREGGALAKALPVFRWNLGGRLGSGEQYWSWIGLEDCVNVLQWMIETQAASGPYNVVAPQAVTNREFTQSLSRVLKVAAWVPVPAWGLRLALGEMADALLLCSCRAIPRRLNEAGFQFQQPELEQFMRQELHRA